MGKTINLCAKIPEELHAQAREEQEELGVTLNEYVKEILEEHFKKKGGKSMSENTRTIAFQIGDENLPDSQQADAERIFCGTH